MQYYKKGNIDKMKNIFKNKNVLVTGAGGSIGSAVCEKLLKYNVKTIRCFDISEYGLYKLQKKLNNDEKIRLLIGDIRDKDRLSRAIHNVDLIVHTAALKHVSFCEYNIDECYKTNVIGTQNVVDLAKLHNVDHSILVSTDKAVNPSSVMGTTKLLAEKIFLNESSHYWQKPDQESKFTVVRFGNVFGSAGSVVETFYNQIKNNKKITLTDENVSRYFISINDASNLIIDCFQYSSGEKIFILKMNQIKIYDLAKRMFEIINDSNLNKSYKNFEYEITGLTYGEKIYESLMTDWEKFRCKDFKSYYIINKEINFPHYKKTEKAGELNYSNETISNEKLESMIKSWLINHNKNAKV